MDNIFLSKYCSGLAIALFAIAISFPMFTTILNSAGGSVNLTENRTLAKFPDLKLTKEGIANFPNEFTNYFNDNFGARNVYIKSNAYIKAFVFGDSPVKDAILGKEGWLYLGTENAIGDYRHSNPLSETELNSWKVALEAKQKWLADRGIAYLFVVAPDKHSVYPEFMPDRFNVVQTDSHIDQLVNYLKKHSSVEVIDPRAELLTAKSKKPTYFKTDHHWNDFGGWVTYLEIMKRLSKNNPTTKIKSENDFEVLEKKIEGQDVANMMGLRENFHEIEIQMRPKEKCAIPVDFKLSPEFHWPLYPPGHEAYSFHCDKEKLKVLVFQDSFGRALVPFISESFKESTFIWDYPNYSVLEAAVKQVKPDVIIEERVERHIKQMIPDFSKPSDLIGIWLSNAKKVEIKELNSNTVFLFNEYGSGTEGVLDNAKIIVKGWGISGTISKNRKKIIWSNGSEWVRKLKDVNKLKKF